MVSYTKKTGIFSKFVSAVNNYKCRGRLCPVLKTALEMCFSFSLCFSLFVVT